MVFLEAVLRKKFPEFKVSATLEAKEGEFIALLGPSGSGKTTMLHLIAGLLSGNGSKISVKGRDLSSLPPEKRNFGMVFQEKLLFPHLNVFENVAFGLRMHGMDPSLAAGALKIMGLSKFSRRDISALSGGERQRVAIARAIAFRPRLLLLDEPLKELDAVMKEQIKVELKRLQRKLNITALYVTHDVEEAFYLSDRVYLIHNGKVLQYGSPIDVFSKPANAVVKKYFSPYILLKHAGKTMIARKTSIAATD
ncbi:MAG: ABC transporter ATP-binding protein [Candidatus Micrarchaeota archaeon]